jgi:hypothetical protein
MAAENVAAAQFALYGFDVLEQAGRSCSAYDLGVAKAGGMLKLTVHGSIQGFWNLIDPYLDTTVPATHADLHRAIDLWLEQHSARITCCLVQFTSENLNQTPRLYLASAHEIAEKLHETIEQLGDTALYEQYEVTHEDGGHAVESLPVAWRFSQQRIADLMRAPAGKPPLRFRFSAAARCTACAAVQPAACLDCLPMMN